MEASTRIISFCHGKGGSGKSTLTNLVASYLKSIGRSVYVADVDTGQGSLIDLRDMEITEGSIGNDVYKLVGIDPDDFPSAFARDMDGEYEYVFVDFPGNLMQPGVISSIATIDYLFIPTGFDVNDLTSFKRFISFYKEKVEPIRKGMGEPTFIRGVWNRVATNVAEFKERHQTAEGLGVEFLESVVPNSFVTFGRNVKSHGKMEYSTGKDYIEQFLKEVCEIIGVKEPAI